MVGPHAFSPVWTARIGFATGHRLNIACPGQTCLRQSDGCGRVDGADMARRTGLFFRAIPDTGRVWANVTAENRLSIGFPNCFVPSPRIQKLISESTQTLWFPGKPVEDMDLPPGAWLVNFCADADEYSRAMTYLEELGQRTGIPIFNAPAGILKSRRDNLPSALEGIEGLTCPRCVRFTPAHPSEFEATFRDNGFAYPVLVRPATSQSGTHMVRIDGPGDWDKIHAIPWGGRALYMTQYVDFRNAAGEFLKIRVACMGDRVVIRHTLYGPEWIVHAMDRTNATIDREFETHAALRANPLFKSVIEEIRSRLGLDFFGVDMGQMADGTFVMFEANAAMSILSFTHMPTYRRADYLKIYKAVEEGLIVALRGFQARAAAPRIRYNQAT